MKARFFYILLAISLLCVLSVGTTAAFVIHKDGKIYIKDQTGERWDVTQAKSIGFKPERFQYGIGKNVFTPLDDSYLHNYLTSAFHSNPRVIGITDGSEARAYSIPKLRHHEIANTRLGTKPVVAGY